MPSLGQLYNDKDAGLTTRKTYNVPLEKIYAEDGYNVRELNQAHVIEFRDAFIAGEYIPPLAVEVTEQGVKVIDGHHRYHGALAAVEMGHEIVRLECKDFTGSEADKIAFMVTSSQGLALTPLERGAAYYRLQNQGWSASEIASKVKRSESDILQHLQLHECTPYIKKLVRDGSMNYAIAIGISREHGVYADREASRLMKKAEAAGKKKVTKSIAKPQFNAGKARRFLELLSSCQDNRDGGITFIVPPALQAEMTSILQEYRYENAPPSNQDDHQQDAPDDKSTDSDAA
jgi:ParB family chromosome partitioning protein